MILQRTKSRKKAAAIDKQAAAPPDTPKSGFNKTLLRIVAGLFFISYLALAAPMTWSWGWSVYYKNQPASRIDAWIASALDNPNQSEFMAWLKLRPTHERNDIILRLEPYSSKLDPFFFLMFSQWKAEELNIEDTVFWHFYARFRLRFDALRCGAPDSVKVLDGLMALMPEKHITATVQRWPQLIPHSIGRVLEYDAKYPANNNPNRICSIVHRIENDVFKTVNPQHWPQIRHTLRARTELSLREMEGAPPPKNETQDPAAKDPEQE